MKILDSDEGMADQTAVGEKHKWLSRSSVSFRKSHCSEDSNHHQKQQNLSTLLKTSVSSPSLLLSDAETHDDHSHISKLQILQENTEDISSIISVSENSTNDHSKINLSFCGCGFLGMYHVGVASAFHEFAPHISVDSISGVSAGSLVAVAHLCGNIQLAHTLTAFLEVAIDARSRTLGPLHPAFRLQDSVRESLQRVLPEDIHIKASGKLHLSLTRVRDGENVIINQFESKEELIQAILCSCFIPLFSGMIAPKFRGTRYVDGGFSNNQIILNDHTITVSPFAGECDICPLDENDGLVSFDYSGTSMVLSAHNIYRIGRALMPFSPEFLFEQCEQGFADAIRYMQKANLISCTRCIEIRSSTIVSIEEIEASRHRNEARINKSYKSIVIEQSNSQNHRTNHKSTHKSTSRRGAPTNSNQQTPPKRCYDCKDEVHDSTLPAHYNERFAQICDKLNKDLFIWLYSHRPIYILKCMTLPYYLPIDLSLALCNRCKNYLLSSFESLIKSCGSAVIKLLREFMIDCGTPEKLVNVM